MDITEVARRTRELVGGVESGVGKALDAAEGNLARTASRSQAGIDAAFARAQEATARLADLSALPLMLGIARKELPKAADALHQEYRNGGVQQVAADARHVMHEVNVGAGQVVKPIVAQLLTPARENGKATAAALRGDWKAAAKHQVTSVVADARTLMPAQVAALEAGLAARKQGKEAVGVVAAASEAGNRVGLDVANGMNPLYLFPVAGEDGHQSVRKLLLDRDLQGFGRESMAALLHGVQATTSAMGLADAAVMPARFGLGGVEVDLADGFGRPIAGGPGVRSPSTGALRDPLPIEPGAVHGTAPMRPSGPLPSEIPVGPDGLPRINGRLPINAAEYAGRVYFDKLPPELKLKYPNGVTFRPNGMPDFTPHATRSVELEHLRGDTHLDYKAANDASGLARYGADPPANYTWHHCEDGRTMQLVPSDVHDAVKHTGGEAVIGHLQEGAR